MKLLQFLFALTFITFISCNNISDKLSPEDADTEATDDNEEPDLYADDDETESSETLSTNNETETNEETSEETSEETAEIVKEVVKEKVTPGQFYIIAGSFKDYQKAENLYKELSAKGYSESKILDPVNKFSRVVIGSYNDEGQARGELKKLRKQYNDESIWLLTAK